MEGDSDLPTVPGESNFFKPNPSRQIKINPDSLSRPFYATSTGNSTSSSSSSSPSKLVRDFQAAFKRRRPSGTLQSNRLKPMRFPQDETPKDVNIQPRPAISRKQNEEIPQDHGMRGSFSQSKNIISVAGENHVDSTMTAPSEWASTGNTRGEDFKPSNAQRDQPRDSAKLASNHVVASSCTVPGNVLAEVQKKVHFAVDCSAPSRGATETVRMATGMEDLLSDMDSLSLTEMELDAGYQGNTSATVNQEWQQHNFQSIEMNATTQSSIPGSSTAASTFINQASAPRITSTTYSSQSRLSDHMNTDTTKVADVKGGVSSHQPVTLQAISSIATLPVEVDKSLGLSEEPQSVLLRAPVDSKHSPNEDYDSNKGNTAADVKSQPPPSKVPLSEQKVENSKSEKLERSVSAKTTSTSRKKGYDPDLFFSVNGKLYQRLGKIGSGGSSEVHKVITSDCIIYALKKIKLRGRDYATAYGFCQEVVYLNKLKGKDNIIQLIDYEVTNKALLQQVMSGCMSNKDAIVKDDSYIYMVLEHGEIDLAHMLAQQWKKLEGPDSTIDENWLRFYWQQILLAVNTIHEERIVHSDLKPANFLLVKGSLKLIDFGIAKAIMNDTTNIQRDSQVGTLSYMSPEAFLCNETDANGNIIKCGRPSDIWSLGCILYQMVYGRTPFSEYKTFWNKFKVITDPNHEIVYEPVSNPLLLDLMKKCLAWDRNERWRIPELLQHQFLAPPVSDKTCKLFQYITEWGPADEKTVMICSELENLVGKSSIPRDELLESLCKISTLSFQLQRQLANS